MATDPGWNVVIDQYEPAIHHPDPSDIGSTGGGTGSAGLYGTGSPEGVKTADPGTTYLDTDTGDFWVKKTGTGNTGWLELIGE